MPRSDKPSYCGRCGLPLDRNDHMDMKDCIRALQDELRERGRCSSCDRKLTLCAGCTIKKKAVKKVAEAGGPLLGGITQLLDGLVNDEDDRG